jgi:chromosome segregation ATPase
MKIITKLSTATNGSNWSLLPSDTVKNTNNAISALSAYEKAVEAANKKTHKLKEAETQLAAANERLTHWQKELAEATDPKTTEMVAANKEELQRSKERIAAIQEEINKRREAVAELERLYEAQGVDKRGTITDASGNTRSLRKEKNALKNSEGQLNAEEGVYSALEAEITAYEEKLAECNRNIESWGNSIAEYTEKVKTLTEAFDSQKLVKTAEAYKVLREALAKLGIDMKDIPTEYTAEGAEALTNSVAKLKAETNAAA